MINLADELDGSATKVIRRTKQEADLIIEFSDKLDMSVIIRVILGEHYTITLLGH